MHYNKKLARLAIIVFSIFFALTPIEAKATEEKSDQTEEFVPGEFILEHVMDCYGWHITTINKKHISIPLPIILWDQGKLVCFSSAKFHHGHNAYKGYALGFTEETSGKIIKLSEPYTGPLKKDAVYQFSRDFTDISITKNVCALLISVVILIAIFLSVAKSYKKRPLMPPKGLQSLMEVLIVFVRDNMVIPSIGEKHYKKYLPYILTLFFFILFNNLLGLIPIFPGGANVTGNIAVTAILALLTLLITSFSGNKNYWKHIFNTPGVPWWLKFPIPLMPIVEFMGVFTKPFVLMIRLFANITAGHIIIMGFLSLIFIFGAMNPVAGYGISILSMIFYLFMSMLELIVAFVQAYIFALLTSMYIGTAVEDHSEHETEPVAIAETAQNQIVEENK